MPEEANADSKFLTKAALYGATLVEVAAERERQIKAAPRQPSLLSEIVAGQMLGRDEEALKKQLRASAKLLAQPGSNRPPPVTEIEKLLAAAPKTEAQNYGYHKVPHVSAPPAPAPVRSDDPRALFPRTEAGMCGFHHDFRKQRMSEVSEARGLVQGLTMQQVQGDKKLATALATIRRRSTELERRKYREEL
jgi:hypothetical protein